LTFLFLGILNPINAQKSIQELADFFKQGNEEEIINFFNYMRSRDLTEEKAKWTKKV